MTFINEAERVWIRLKDAAAQLVEDKQSINESEARRIVDEIVREENAISTPAEARDFFAIEFLRMTADRAAHRDLCT
jgi:polyhydroxyalkanoate synthesis regulator phasin